MERSPRLAAAPDPLAVERDRIHDWRVEQLRRLGLPAASAARAADRVDWHAVAALVARGCPPALAVRIVE
jgi:hypothetical protein